MGHQARRERDRSFPNLDYKVVRDLGPGEIVRLRADSIEVLQPAFENEQICSFLWVYYGFPASDYEGINVEKVREDNGRMMGEKDDTEVDCVCGIPDSGVGMALGYAEGKGVPYKRAVLKYTPTWPRSFTPGNQSRRDLVAKMKLIPNGALLKDQRVVFCDDSIVRGTQLRDNVRSSSAAVPRRFTAASAVRRWSTAVRSSASPPRRATSSSSPAASSATSRATTRRIWRSMHRPTRLSTSAWSTR